MLFSFNFKMKHAHAYFLLHQPVATYFGGRKIYEKINGREIYWPENRGPPLDVPICGFDGTAPKCLAPCKYIRNAVLSVNAVQKKVIFYAFMPFNFFTDVFPLEGMILLSLAAVACLGSIIGFFMYK